MSKADKARELEPCPFDDENGEHNPRIIAGPFYSVECTCGALGPDATDEEMAVRRWNTRTLSPSLDTGLREALETCRDKFREYERLHRAKIKEGPFYAHTNEEAKVKANRNAEMAEMCEAALYHASTPIGERSEL